MLCWCLTPALYRSIFELVIFTPFPFFPHLLSRRNSFGLEFCGFGFWFGYFMLFWGGFKAFPFWEGLEDFVGARSRWNDMLSWEQPMVTWRTWELGWDPKGLTCLEIRYWAPGVGKRPECGKSWIPQSGWRSRSSACSGGDGRKYIAFLKLSSSVRNFTSQEKCDLCFLVIVWWAVWERT